MSTPHSTHHFETFSSLSQIIGVKLLFSSFYIFYLSLFRWYGYNWLVMWLPSLGVRELTIDQRACIYIDIAHSELWLRERKSLNQNKCSNQQLKKVQIVNVEKCEWCSKFGPQRPQSCPERQKSSPQRHSTAHKGTLRPTAALYSPQRHSTAYSGLNLKSVLERPHSAQNGATPRAPAATNSSQDYNQFKTLNHCHDMYILFPGGGYRIPSLRLNHSVCASCD